MGIPWIFECGHYFAHGDHAVAECLSTTEFVLRYKQTTNQIQTNMQKYTQIHKNTNTSPTATMLLLSAFLQLSLYSGKNTHRYNQKDGVLSLHLSLHASVEEQILYMYYFFLLLMIWISNNKFIPQCSVSIAHSIHTDTYKCIWFVNYVGPDMLLIDLNYKMQTYVKIHKNA